MLINLWLWEWMLQCITCDAMDPCNVSRTLSSVVWHCFPNFFFLVYHYHNTKHTPLGIVTVNAYFQHTGLPGCSAGWQFWSLLTFQTAKEQLWGNHTFCICCFSNLLWLDNMSLYLCYSNNKLASLYTLYKFFLYISTHLQQFWQWNYCF